MQSAGRRRYQLSSLFWQKLRKQSLKMVLLAKSGLPYRPTKPRPQKKTSRTENFPPLFPFPFLLQIKKYSQSSHDCHLDFFTVTCCHSHYENHSGDGPSSLGSLPNVFGPCAGDVEIKRAHSCLTQPFPAFAKRIVS